MTEIKKAGEQTTTDPRERIISTAAGLFARYGSSAVGVRDIAREADVNLSMISYYFDGKTGLLKEIIKGFFDDLFGVILRMKNELPNAQNPEERIRALIRDVVELIKTKPDQSKVAIMEMSIKPGELYDYKVEILKQHLSLVTDAFQDNQHQSEDKELRLIVGPALFSLIYSHFLFGDLLKQVFDVEYDERFLDRYAEVISVIYLKGIVGLREEIRKC